MSLQVRRFAMLRERPGSDLVEVDVAEGATVSDVLDGLANQHKSPAEILTDRRNARIHTDPLSADRLVGLVATDHTGAIVTFQGTTRDVERLGSNPYVPVA